MVIWSAAAAFGTSTVLKATASAAPLTVRLRMCFTRTSMFFCGPSVVPSLASSPTVPGRWNRMVDLSERVERAAILRAPTDADGGAGLDVGHALRIRHLDHEVLVTEQLHPRAGVVAEIDQLLHLRLELVGAGAVGRVDAHPRSEEHTSELQS